MVKIITDSASDLLQDEAKELGVEVLPLKSIFGKDEYLDGVNLSHEKFYELLAKSKDIPTTSQINPYDYRECFKKYKGEDVVCITISSTVSGCYQSALIAASEFDNIKVVDSLNMSVGEQILVRYALRLVNKGKNSTEIAEELDKVKRNIRIIALFDTLEYLKKGGRISGTTAFIGTLLNIKPVIAIADGIVENIGKARGSKNGNNVLRNYVKECGGIDLSMPYRTAYSGSDNSNLLRYIEDSRDLYECDPKDVPMSSMGSTIGTHAGPGAFGVAFFKKS